MDQQIKLPWYRPIGPTSATWTLQNEFVVPSETWNIDCPLSTILLSPDELQTPISLEPLHSFFDFQGAQETGAHQMALDAIG